MNDGDLAASPEGFLAEEVLLGLKGLIGDRDLDDNEKRAVAKLLQLMAMRIPPPRPCTACSRMVWFFKTRRGRLMPIDNSGKAHFANCSHPEWFRKDKR